MLYHSFKQSSQNYQILIARFHYNLNGTLILFWTVNIISVFWKTHSISSDSVFCMTFKCFSLKSRKSLSMTREKICCQTDDSYELSVFCIVRAMQKCELISPEAYCLLGAGQVRICALRYCFSDRLKCNALFLFAAWLNRTQMSFQTHETSPIIVIVYYV